MTGTAVTLFDLNGEQRFTGTSVGGGGAQPSTQTATVTTDPNLFYATHVFDCGHPTVVYVAATIIALTPAGETFGGGAGQIGVDLSSDSLLNTPSGISRDNITWVGAGQQLFPLGTTPPFAVSAVIAAVYYTARYIQPFVEIYSNDAGDIYAGANHPTAQVRLDIEYL